MIHQVAGEFRLAVDHDRRAGEALEVDALTPPEKRKLEAVVDQTLLVHPLAAAGAVEQVDGPDLQHPGANAPENVVAVDAVEDDVVDTRIGEQLAEQQPGRAGADDNDLGAHGNPP